MRNGLEVSRGNRTPAWNASDIDEMFERMWRNPFSLLEEMRPSMMTDSQWFQPNFGVDETESAYLLSIDLPGVRKEDIKVDLTENVLTISGERKQEREAKDRAGRRFERSYGRFQRSFALPNSVEVEKVEANLEDGVLHIALPKVERAKPRSIQVQSGRGGFFSKLIGSNRKEEKKAEDAGGATH
ncbi:MAG: Hsp20/alpha crystallin family protein [Bdellovibrionales bacterium]